MSDKEEGWAIVQHAPGEPRNKTEPIFLALVDRLKTQELWWTADDPKLVMKFHKKHAADHSAARLKGAVVILFEHALKTITEQKDKFSGEK
tara:strand:+ start:276 stop:548 length:273 start_codon:yes stop_codon:yes gene_type:complete